MNNYGGVSLNDYAQTGNGYGSASFNDVQELNKALEATNLRGGASEGLSTVSGAPLKVESLEQTLKVVTYTMKNIVLWKDMPILPAYNTVEEYNRLSEYGSDGGGFYSEGELPQEDDSSYSRHSELVKYLGNTRIITHPMTLVNSVGGSVIQREIQNGTLWILKKVERGLFFANSNLVPEQFNGFFEQQESFFGSLKQAIDAGSVIDLRGKSMTEAAIEQGCEQVIENFGVASDLYWATSAGRDYNKQFYPRQRVPVPTGQNLVSGGQYTGFQSQSGLVKFHPDVFLNQQKPKNASTNATSSKAPSRPLSGGTPVAAVAPVAVNTKFAVADAGDYRYAVTGVNKFGESSLRTLNPVAVSVVSSGAVDLEFTDGGGTEKATSFRIYRTKLGDASVSPNYYPLFDVSAQNVVDGYNGGAAGKIRDLNYFLPGTTQAFLPERDTEVLSVKQLAPLMKMDLAVISPAIRFMILLYITPLLYAPKKMVRYINVGSDSDPAINALIA